MSETNTAGQEERVPTKEKLATAMERANAPGKLIRWARDGYYDELFGPLDFPLITLIGDLRLHNLSKLARRVEDGEFEPQKWEWEEWEQTEEGQASKRTLLGLGLIPNEDENEGIQK